MLTLSPGRWRRRSHCTTRRWPVVRPQGQADRDLILRNCRLHRSGRSILLLHLNDSSAMGALADLLVLVVRLDLEAKLAAVNLQELGSNRDLLALGRGAEVLDVDLEADCRVPFGEMGLHG